MDMPTADPGCPAALEVCTSTPPTTYSGKAILTNPSLKLPYRQNCQSPNLSVRLGRTFLLLLSLSLPPARNSFHLPRQYGVGPGHQVH